MMTYDFPLPSGAGEPFEISRQARAVLASKVRRAVLFDYLSELEQASFTCIASNQYPGGIFYTYTDGRVKLTVSYLLQKKDLRVIFEDYKPLPDFSAKGEDIHDKVSLIQFCTHTSRSEVTTTASGMGYVLRLRDGRLIVIDGGFHSPPDYADDYPVFRDLLWDLSGGKKPHVALWVITHPHADHFHVLSSMTEEDATVDAYLSTLVKRGTAYSGDADHMERKVPLYAEKNIPAHTGDRFDFGDAQLEIYTCCEEPESYDPTVNWDGNNQSLIFGLCIGDQKVLFTGDAYLGAEEYAMMIAGGRIRADICQIGHHGRIGGLRGDIFYSLVAPKVALWPGCYAQIDHDLEVYGTNTWTLGSESTVLDHYVATDGHATLTFPYEIQHRPYCSPLKK